MIIQRDHIEDQRIERRVIGAQQRLGAAGAFLGRQPDHRRPRLGGGRLRDADAHQRRQAQGRRDAGAVFQELAAGQPAQRPLVTIGIGDLVSIEIEIVDIMHERAPPATEANTQKLVGR